MYLHIGQNVIIPFQDVVGPFDLDNTSPSRLTRSFLERAEKEGRLVNVSDDLPRSFVLCSGQEGPPVVYLCQLSTAALLRRAENNSFE